MKCHKMIYFVNKKNEKIYNNENRQRIQTKLKIFGSDWTECNFKIKPIG